MADLLPQNLPVDRFASALEILEATKPAPVMSIADIDAEKIVGDLLVDFAATVAADPLHGARRGYTLADWRRENGL